MGLLDKAKQLAEQAQTKLDEVQQQFNERSGSSQEGPVVESDEHGRPIRDEGDTAPPHGDPLAEEQPAQPAPPAAAPAPDASAPPEPPTPPPAPDAPEPPADDPNRPSYEPPKLSGGDPLAG